MTPSAPIPSVPARTKVNASSFPIFHPTPKGEATCWAGSLEPPPGALPTAVTFIRDASRKNKTIHLRTATLLQRPTATSTLTLPPSSGHSTRPAGPTGDSPWASWSWPAHPLPSPWGSHSTLPPRACVLGAGQSSHSTRAASEDGRDGGLLKARDPALPHRRVWSHAVTRSPHQGWLLGPALSPSFFHHISLSR